MHRKVEFDIVLIEALKISIISCIYVWKVE